MTTAAAIFECREVEWDLYIEPGVLDRFAAHRQLGARAPEVGGQLFAAFEKYRVRIIHATGPRETDRRSRCAFFPDRRTENREIRERFGAGLHFIGDWHTHPEPHPTPSGVDLSSMRDCFRKSRHSLTHFVMIVVGQREGPVGLWVSLHDAKHSFRMTYRDPHASTLLPPADTKAKKPRFAAMTKVLRLAKWRESK